MPHNVPHSSSAHTVIRSLAVSKGGNRHRQFQLLFVYCKLLTHEMDVAKIVLVVYENLYTFSYTTISNASHLSSYLDDYHSEQHPHSWIHKLPQQYHGTTRQLQHHVQ